MGLGRECGCHGAVLRELRGRRSFVPDMRHICHGHHMTANLVWQARKGEREFGELRSIHHVARAAVYAGPVALLLEEGL